MDEEDRLGRVCRRELRGAHSDGLFAMSGRAIHSRIGIVAPSGIGSSRNSPVGTKAQRINSSSIR
jgi:hypothetical protein